MKFNVDLKTCENHGQCTYLAPDFFALDETGKLTYRAEAAETYTSPEIDVDAAEDVQEAADMCPVQAILMES
jgi:ferredoxin